MDLLFFFHVQVMVLSLSLRSHLSFIQVLISNIKINKEKSKLRLCCFFVLFFKPSIIFPTLWMVSFSIGSCDSWGAYFPLPPVTIPTPEITTSLVREPALRKAALKIRFLKLSFRQNQHDYITHSMSVGLQGGIICFGWEGDEQLAMMSREDT